jgi:cytochrome c556
MARKLSRMVACVTAAMMAAVSVAAFADDKDEPRSIKEVMKEHKKGGKLPEVKDALKAGKWDAAESPAKKLKENAVVLAKLKPEKGDLEAWKKIAESYKENTSDLYEAIQKKDKEKSQELVKKLDASCMPCHKAYR